MTKKAKRKSMKTGTRAPTEPRNTTIPVGVVVGNNTDHNMQGIFLFVYSLFLF